MTIPRGRRPSASADEIIAAYRKKRSIEKVCRALHTGRDRAKRILEAAGFTRIERGRGQPAMPDNYLLAVSGYQKGVAIAALKDRYNISLPQLYIWLDRCGVARRSAQEWRCRECGAPTAYGELFCNDDHRREYDAAALAPGFEPPRQYRREPPCQSTA